MTPRPIPPSAVAGAFAFALLASAIPAGAAADQGATGPGVASPPAVTPRPPAAPPPGVLDPFAHVLPPAGRPKCAAFRRVRADTQRLEARTHGPLSAAERRRLGTELQRARAMAPKEVTAADCGVAL